MDMAGSRFPFCLPPHLRCPTLTHHLTHKVGKWHRFLRVCFRFFKDSLGFASERTKLFSSNRSLIAQSIDTGIGPFYWIQISAVLHISAFHRIYKFPKCAHSLMSQDVPRRCRLSENLDLCHTASRMAIWNAPAGQLCLHHQHHWWLWRPNYYFEEKIPTISFWQLYSLPWVFYILPSSSIVQQFPDDRKVFIDNLHPGTGGADDVGRPDFLAAITLLLSGGWLARFG